MIVSLIRVRSLTCVMVRPACRRADVRISPMLTRHLHCPITPRATHGVMAGTKHHSPPIPQRGRSPGAIVRLQSGENRRGIPACPLARVRVWSRSVMLPGICCLCQRGGQSWREQVGQMSDAAEVAERYFTAWQARDESALTQILAEDVTFRGPLGTANGRAECIAGLLGMLGIVTSIEVQARVADEHDVITWFELHTSVAPPAPTANWSHVQDGQITRIRVAFDPREIVRSGS